MVNIAAEKCRENSKNLSKCLTLICQQDVKFLIMIKSGPEVIKFFPCSTQLSMEFQMLISLNISRNSAFLWLRYTKIAIFPAHKC